MTLTFLVHQWKAFWRSKNAGRSVIMKIVMGLLILYLLANILIAAFFLNKILAKTYPDQNTLITFNSFILYYFLIDLLLRFQMQELPTLSVMPYLHLPIKRNQIVNYLSLISLGTAFNLSPFLISLSFLMNKLLPAQGQSAFWGILLSIAGLTMFNHFFSLWLKRKVNLNAIWMLAFMGTLLVLLSFDYYFRLISISNFSTSLFNNVSVNPIYSLLSLMLAAGMYLVHHQYLKNNLYLDDLHSNDASHKSSTEVPFLNHFGRAGDLAANELKLILRNKRPRSMIMVSLMIMFYGLIFYTKSEFGYAVIVFCGMLMTGVFIINYGQFMFSWQSAHFDGILSASINIEDFFRSKFLLFTLFSSLCFILTIPYVYFGWKILIVHFIMYIWNLGVNTVAVLFFANRNYMRIDLSKGAAFNWEGVGASQLILLIPVLLAPFAIYFPLSLLGYEEAGLALIAIIGLAFIITRDFWLNRLVSSFKVRRYAIADGFRNQSI